MKTRYRVRCESPHCRRFIEIGRLAIRVHGRLWHPECALAFQRHRRVVTGHDKMAASVPNK